VTKWLAVGYYHTVLNFTSVLVSSFNEKEIKPISKPITMSDPDNYKGISAIAFKPDHMSAHDEILSIGYFGGYIEHWNLTSSNLLLILSDKT
jgi:hypothetical protein